MSSDDDIPILIYRRAGREFSRRRVRLFAETLGAEVGGGITEFDRQKILDCARTFER